MQPLGAHASTLPGFFPMLFMIGHPPGNKPLMMDVRQSGSGPLALARIA